MRAYQVFGSMAQEQAVQLFAMLAEKAPALYTQAVGVACVAMKARPVFLMKQPAEKRAEALRRALARVKANDMAEELLATYFLDCRRELLIEWLDQLGLEHEEGVLQALHPEAPPREKIEQALEGFRRDEEREDRELLLRAFAAQGAIDWPELDAALSAG